MHGIDCLSAADGAVWCVRVSTGWEWALSVGGRYAGRAHSFGPNGVAISPRLDLSFTVIALQSFAKMGDPFGPNTDA